MDDENGPEKDKMEDDGDEAIDELDKENFRPKQTRSSNGGTTKRLSASAAGFHPDCMRDEIHDNFLEEIKKMFLWG